MQLFKDAFHSLRSLRRSPGFACVAVATLALGIGATIALVSVIDAVLLRSFGYADPSRLAEISAKNAKGRNAGIASGDLAAFDTRVHAFAAAGANRVQTFTLTGPHEPRNIWGGLVSRHLFEALGAKPLAGRTFASGDFQSGAAPVAIFSHKLWQTALDGDPQAVGRRVLMNGAQYTVIGIMRPEFQLRHPVFQVWTPWQLSAAELSDHSGHGFNLIARLRPGVSLAAAQAELDAFGRSLAAEHPAEYTGWRATAGRFDAGSVENVRTALEIFLGAVLFVLLIACLNVANLLMARGIERGREIVIRMALGASRLRIVAQLLMESLAIAVLGGLAGLLLARVLLAILLAALPSGTFAILPRIEETRLDGRALAAAAVLTLLCGFLFGLAPALKLSARRWEHTLKESGRAQSGGRGSRHLLSGLIVVETALAVILLAGAGLLLRSFSNVLRLDPGFHAEHVLTVQVPSSWVPVERDEKAETERKQRRFHEMLERVSQVPGIDRAALTTVLPLGHVDVMTVIYLEGRPPSKDEDNHVHYRAASPEYFRVMGIPLLAGRAFNESDQPGAPEVAIVSQAMASRFWPGQDPIGKHFSYSDGGKGPWTMVVGVAGNAYFDDRHEPEAELYSCFRQRLMAAQVTTLVLRTRLDPTRLAAPVRAAIRRFDPGQPIAEVMSMPQVLSDSTARQRLYAVLLSVFAALALLLAAAGSFSVVSWTTSRRTHEIGIRMALGAEPGRVVLSVMRRTLMEMVAGVIAGLAGAAALTGILKSQLFSVAATDPATFAAAALALALVALFAALLPARRAARLDPSMALREEG